MKRLTIDGVEFECTPVKKEEFKILEIQGAFLYKRYESGLFKIDNDLYLHQLRHFDLVSSDSKYKITKVEDKNGYVFQIGDFVTKQNWQKINDCKIEKFFLEDNELKVIINQDGVKANYSFDGSFKKVLTTTPYNEPIAPNDYIYLLEKDTLKTSGNSHVVHEGYNFGEEYLYFLSDSSMNKYIEENKRKVLFITEDGVEIFQSDSCYFIYPSTKKEFSYLPFQIYIVKFVTNEPKSEKLLYFAKKENAEKYIYENQPITITRKELRKTVLTLFSFTSEENVEKLLGSFK